MTKQELLALLPETEDAEKFSSYCVRLQTEKDSKTGQLKNPWSTKKTENDFAILFKRVANE